MEMNHEHFRTGPFEMDGCDTVVKLWALRCREKGAQTAHRSKELGIWQAYSWSYYYESARAIGLGLMALGHRKGEPVQILAEDRREWMYCDLAIAALGGIPSGVYTTDSAAQDNGAN